MITELAERGGTRFLLLRSPLATNETTQVSSIHA